MTASHESIIKKVILNFGGIFICAFHLLAQNVGIGTTTPLTKLDVRGALSAPSIPGTSSSGMTRIGNGAAEGIDVGITSASPYSGWIQKGFNGAAEPLSLQPLGGNVGIGTISPVGAAALDVSSTTQGFLPPRMTYAQRNAISNPVAGLVVWCSDCDELQVFNGVLWKNLAGRNASPPGPPYVTICDQDVMIKNLNVSTYRNGDPIPKVTSTAAWAALTTGAYCYYNNDSITYAATYGKIYNWYAVNDPRGLAPEGWHVPTYLEWTSMADCLDGTPVAGGKIKEVGLSHWNSPNAAATNSSGFTALPGGRRFNIGTFTGINAYSYFWSSTEYLTDKAYWVASTWFDGELTIDVFFKQYGFSVRCIRD